MPTSDQKLQQKKKAEAFLALHSRPEPLLLANVWDAASARIIEDAGFPAIATSSAGIAFALGHPDGQKISRGEMLAAVALIAQSVAVPVSADAEAGYGDRPDDAAQTAKEVIEAGAIGMNFEDATGQASKPLADLPLQVERIQAIRETGEKYGVPLVINARTDVYLLQVGDPAGRYDEALRRMSAYRDAGAGCVFVPGLQDVATITRFVKDLQCPVNILAGAGSPTVSELAAAGVKRISLGSSPMRAGLGMLRRVAQELKTKGTYGWLEGAPPHAEINLLMSKKSKSTH